MARKIRWEEAGAYYHVINRGNYRQWIFEDEGAKRAFEATLFEACERAGWVLHAFCIMGNHFHLALETPDGNLTVGMRWLQSVFATRFNRFRKESGHLFQGRFKSLIVEDVERLAWLCHYIHLNPVRAGLCSVEALPGHRWSSIWHLHNPKERPSFLKFEACLGESGGWRDDRAGRERYGRYLAWLVEDLPAQKAMAFAQMSRGWALGSREFKKSLVAEERQARVVLRQTQTDATEARELAWQSQVERCLKALGKGVQDVSRDRKSADWKVAVAGHMKANGLCTNRWLAKELNMGVEFAVSRYVGEMAAGKRDGAGALESVLTAKIKY